MRREINTNMKKTKFFVQRHQNIVNILDSATRGNAMIPISIKKISKALKDAIDQESNAHDIGETVEYIRNIYISKVQASIKKRGREKIPTEYYDLLLRITEIMEITGGSNNDIDYYLKSIIKVNKEDDDDLQSIKLKAEYMFYIRQLKNQLKKGESIGETKQLISEIIKRDTNHILDTEKLSSFEDYDMLKSYFYTVNPIGKSMKEILKEKNVLHLAHSIFPPGVLEKSNNGNRENNDAVSNNSSYSTDLSAMKRLEFFLNNFNISNVLVGKENSEQAEDGSFYGSILFEMEDSDVVIVEDFFSGKPGKEKESYAKATYILGKSEAIRMIKSEIGRLQVKQGNKENNAFKTVNHMGEYYKRVIDRYNEVVRALEKEPDSIEDDSKSTVNNEQPDSFNNFNSNGAQHVEEIQQKKSETKDEEINIQEDNQANPESEHYDEKIKTEDEGYSEKEEEVATLIAKLIKISSLEYSIYQANRLHKLLISRMKDERSTSNEVMQSYKDKQQHNQTPGDYDEDSENR